MATFNLLIRIADRLGNVERGSPEADRAIHTAIAAEGPAFAYTTDDTAAHLLLPAGFEWREPIYSSGMVYASCRRIGMDGAWPYPHHGQWGKTPALAMCGAAVRARAALTA